MHLEDFKWWYWVAISIVVGALLGWSRMSAAPDEQFGSDRRGISAVDFVNKLRAPKSSKGYRLVSDIVIYPLEVSIDPSSSATKHANFVTCTTLERQPDGRFIAHESKLYAEVPFHAGYIVKAKSGTYSIRDYIDEEAKISPDITFRYAWWDDSKMQFILWMGGSIVLIGGVWPVIVNLIIGAGLTRPKKAKEEYDLDRFGGSSTSSRPAVAKTGPTADQSDQLRDMQDAMEKDLEAAGMKMTSAPPPNQSNPQSAATPTVKTLSGGAPTAPAPKEAESGPKEYGGEFYPVVKSNQPRDEEK